jgi:hypothetical protein
MNMHYLLPVGLQRFSTAVLSAGLLALLSSTASAGTDFDQFATQLTDLRKEVQKLNEDIAQSQEDTSSQLRSLRNRTADVELESQREELRKQQARQALQAIQKTIQTADLLRETIAPALNEGLSQLKQYVEAQLPFKQKERLAQVAKLEKQIVDGLIPTDKAANRLWGIFEDELRLTRESGLYKQPVLIGQSEYLADVVRIGMLAMFYRTDEGKFGRIVRREGDWKNEELSSEEDLRMVDSLFDQFRKNIRVGYFNIPNVLN